jgi:hypothetical protein
LKHDLASLKKLLEAAPAVPVTAQLVRLVPFADLVAYDPPDWLYTSGRPNRCNPAGIDCVYFGESKEVAQAEYEEMWKGIVGAKQPVTTYHADVALSRVLDLSNSATLQGLEIDAKELSKSWRQTKRPTVTQLLGQAVSETRLFSAMRLPSKACANRGQAGCNFVIFRDCVRPPDSVRIIGPTGRPLQEWP